MSSVYLPKTKRKDLLAVFQAISVLHDKYIPQSEGGLYEILYKPKEYHPAIHGSLKKLVDEEIFEYLDWESPRSNEDFFGLRNSKCLVTELIGEVIKTIWEKKYPKVSPDKKNQDIFTTLNTFLERFPQVANVVKMDFLDDMFFEKYKKSQKIQNITIESICKDITIKNDEDRARLVKSQFWIDVESECEGFPVTQEIFDFMNYLILHYMIIFQPIVASIPCIKIILLAFPWIEQTYNEIELGKMCMKAEKCIKNKIQ